MIITIDGPSGTGKSTVAKLVAYKLGWDCLDTGAFYRGFACFLLKEEITDLTPSVLARKLKEFEFSCEHINQEKRYLMNGEDVTDELRNPQVTELSSKISTFSEVRHHIVQLQRQYAKEHSIVGEGRDLGTVVFPKAEIKIFLTADPKVRAERRFDQMAQKDASFSAHHSVESILIAQEERDKRDIEREHSPLVCPNDAIIIDTTSLSADQVVSAVIEIYKNHASPGMTLKKNLKAVLYYFVLIFTWIFFKVFFRLQVKGRENLKHGGGIVASNHTSFFDPPLIAVAVWTQVHFLARESLFKVPVLKNIIRILNAHPLKGGMGDVSVIKMVQRLIQKQQKIIMFPEGTRSHDGTLLPLKRGVANIIVRTCSTVYPAYIHGAHSVWSRGMKLPRLFKKITVVFGEPIYGAKYALMDRKQAQEHLTKDLETAILSLQNHFINSQIS
jgi:cytidylate kinase